MAIAIPTVSGLSATGNLVVAGVANDSGPAPAAPATVLPGAVVTLSPEAVARAADAATATATAARAGRIEGAAGTLAAANAEDNLAFAIATMRNFSVNTGIQALNTVARNPAYASVVASYLGMATLAPLAAYTGLAPPDMVQPVTGLRDARTIDQYVG